MTSGTARRATPADGGGRHRGGPAARDGVAGYAALLLAQGAGRLIRGSGDRGVVSVLDSRLATAGYGNALRASLPPFWFTTDGDLANRLAHPRYGHRRTYLVKVKGDPPTGALGRLLEGVRLEDGPAKALEATLHEKVEKNSWIRMRWRRTSDSRCCW